MKDLRPIIRTVYDAHGKLPSAAWLAQTAKVPLEEATRALGEYSVEEAPFQQVQEAPTEVAPLDTKEVHGLPMTALKWIAGILASAAIVRAMFYALGWYGDDFMGWLMAFLTVGVTVFLPQIVVTLWIKGKRVFSSFVAILTIIVTLFSMVMTVRGIYDARSADATISAQAKQDELRAKGVWQDLVNREAEAQKALDSATREQGRIARELDKLTPDAPLYPAMQTRLDRQTKRTDTLRGDLMNIQMEKAKTGAIVEKREDFFDWLGKVLNVPRDLVEFSAAVIPAVVIDVAAPVLLYIVFFVI
jgi:hypothetical protein